MISTRWEAAKALRRRLDAEGLISQGNPVGWGEAYRVWRECKVIIVFSL